VTIPARPEALDAAWLEAALRAGGAHPSARVRGFSRETIGAGFGFVGVVERLTLDADAAPRSVVAKWCDARGAAAEERFARDVAPTLDVALARLFACVVDGDRAVLVLEDVAPATQGDVLVGATRAQTDALADAMASFHARHWGARDAALARLPVWGDTADDLVRRTRASIEAFLAARGATLSASDVARTRELPERLAVAYERLRRATPTLVHRDLHLDNVLFRADGTPVILDWTDASRGPAAADLGRLVLDALPPERWTRADRRAPLVRYAAAMAARGIDVDPDALLSDVGRIATVAFASYVRTIAAGGKNLPDHPRVPVVVDREIRCFMAASADLDP